MIDDALRAFLLDDTVLVAITGTRIYPDEVPQRATFPAIRYQQVSLVANYNQEGDSNLDVSRYQFDCYAPNRPQANQVAALLRQRLNQLRRLRQDDVIFKSCFMVNALSGYDDSFNQWRMIRDFEITYKELE